MNKENKKKIVVGAVKGVTMLIAGLASASVVGAVVKNIIPLDGLSKYNKAMIVLGTGIIGGVAGEAGGGYAMRIVKDFEEAFNAVGTMFKIANSEIEDQENEEMVPV